MSAIAIIGGGAWGTALAQAVAPKQPETLLIVRDPSQAEAINNTHRNQNYLPDIELHASIHASADQRELANADVVLVAIPAQLLSTEFGAIAMAASDARAFVLTCKGIDRQSGRLPHQVAEDSVEPARIAALSGPSFATDVARGLPTAVTLAAHELSMAQELAEALSSQTFRLYASDDLIGVESGGALKNVMALAVGMARGLALGASAEAALIARGFNEMTRIASALGARPDSLTGLSGLGDLVLTCSSPESRNFSYGMALASGQALPDKLVEGVHTAAIARTVASSHGIEAPIVDAVSQVLAGDLSAVDAARNLLARPLRTEK